MGRAAYSQTSLWEEPKRWVVHVDMDAFYASVEQLDNPALSGLPLVVANSPFTAERLKELAEQARRSPQTELIKGMRGVVASASYDARAYGVRSAMPLARALVLCPDAVVLRGRFDRYREVARQLQAIWADFSPTVEPMSLDEAYLDMTGTEFATGPIRQVAEKLKSRIRHETGLTASIGVGSSKLVAKIASDMEKPDGLVIVGHGEEPEALAPLPVRALPGVGPQTEKLLLSVGVRLIADLARIPYAELAQKVGAEQAGSLKQRAAGIDNNPVQVPGDPKSISNEITLENDTADLNYLRSRVGELGDRVSWRLRKDGLQARCVYIKLRLLPTRREWSPGGSVFSKPITRRCSLPVPTEDGVDISRYAVALLERAAAEQGLTTGKCVVRLLGVGTASLSKADFIAVPMPIEAAMMDPETPTSTPERSYKLNSSIDNIRAKFGFGAIMLGSSSKAPQVKETNRPLD